MSELPRISYSRVRSWRKCHALHDYRHNQKLSPKRKPLPMARGHMVARLLELFYKGEDWAGELAAYASDFERLWTEEQDEYGDLPGDVEKLFHRYIQHYKRDGLVYETVEKKWEFEYQGIMIVARTDAIVRDKERRRWILERKVPKKIPDEETRFSDYQTVLYSWIMEVFDNQRPYGILWDYVRAKLPTVPEVLKSGALSKAAKIDTDYETYLQAIKDNKLEIADYAEILGSLEGREENFFQRVYLPKPSPKQVKMVVDDFMSSAFQIAELGTELKDRNPQRDCKGCEMYKLCRIESRGDDSSFIRKSSYTVEERDANQEKVVDDEVESDA